MSPAARLFHARIERRAAQLAPELRRALLRAYARLARTLTEAQFEVFIRDPSAERLLELEAQIQRSFDEVSRTLRDGVESAGKSVARELPGAARGQVFNVLNPKVLEAVAALDTRVLRELTDQMRETVRSIVEEGLRVGINPRQMARGLQQSIGLSPRDVEALTNFRRMLENGDPTVLTRALRDRRFDSVIRRAIATMGEPREEWFHGTPVDVLKTKEKWFRATAGESGVPAVWGTSDPFVAEGYSRGELALEGPNAIGKYRLERTWYADQQGIEGGVYTLRTKAGARIFTFNAEGKSWVQIPQRQILQQAQAEGYDAVVFRKVIDNYSGSDTTTSDVVAWLNPDKIELGANHISGLSRDRVDGMVEAYRKKLLAHRAETITRTAALDAQRLGEHLTWQAAVERGDIDGSKLTKRWSGTLDDRERDSHLLMEGETVPWDQPFSNNGGQMFPGEGEYNCRCKAIYETSGTVKPGAGARGLLAGQLRVWQMLQGAA